MSQRYPGNIVRATPLTPTGPFQTGAGLWRLDTRSSTVLVAAGALADCG
jgi:hypothetical protein